MTTMQDGETNGTSSPPSAALDKVNATIRKGTQLNEQVRPREALDLTSSKGLGSTACGCHANSDSCTCNVRVVVTCGLLLGCAAHVEPAAHRRRGAVACTARLVGWQPSPLIARREMRSDAVSLRDHACTGSGGHGVRRAAVRRAAQVLHG